MSDSERNRHVASSEDRSVSDLQTLERTTNAPSKPRQKSKNSSKRSGIQDGRKAADKLVDIGRAHDLFHDPGRTAFARVGNAVYAVDSGNYREVLAERFFNLTGDGANRNSIGDAIATLTSLAKFRGECHAVWLRTAAAAEAIVIDTGQRDGSTILVASEGVKEQTGSSVRFRRTNGMLPLPKLAAPDFARIWRYLNVCDEHRPLVAGFMLAALRPVGPYPILFLEGEQGTGKSTAARVIRRLIDPSAAPLRAPPKDVRDMLVGALNGWLLALDNLSYLTPQMSDALCRLATGGAISERALYTNTDEVLIEVQRPVIVNGIEDVATRPDLAERGLHIELGVIGDRQAESDFWASFNADAPAIMGGLLHGLVQSVRGHRAINLGRLPRMADFAKFAAAGMEPLGFTADSFMQSYHANLETGLSTGIESSAVGRAVLAFIRQRSQWSGTAAELLAALSRHVDDSETRSPNWPKSPRAVSGAIKRLAPALRTAGVDISTDRATDRARTRTLRLCNRHDQPSISSAPPTLADASDGSDDQNPILHSADDMEALDL